MKKNLIKIIIETIVVALVLVVSVYAWYTNSDKVETPIEGTSTGIKIRYDFDSSDYNVSEVTIDAKYISYFDITVEDETKYLVDMAAKVELNVTNYSSLSSTFTLTNNNSTEDIYLDFFVVESTLTSTFESFIESTTSSISGITDYKTLDDTLDPLESKTYVLYVFGVAQTNSLNTDIYSTNRSLSLTLQATEIEG